MHLKLLAAS